MYTPSSNPKEWFLKQIKESEKTEKVYSIRGLFDIKEKYIEKITTESAVIRLGELIGEYYKINKLTSFYHSKRLKDSFQGTLFPGHSVAAPLTWPWPSILDSGML